MKRRVLKVAGIVIGLFVLLVLVSGPILNSLGVEIFCIQGDLSDLQFVRCSGVADPQPTVTPLPLPTLAQEVPIPVIFDDDGSPDGIIALLYFLRHPLYDVKAVTVSAGEAHPKIFAEHIAQFLAALGRGDIPVGFGRETPLDGDNAFPEPWREASDRFFGIPVSQSTLTSEVRPASELIVETLYDSTEPMMVFVSGTHTNLAEALRLDPGIGDHIRGVYVMGGSIYVPGNIQSDWPEIHNTVAEWNIWVDPLAASEVFSAGLPLHLVPIDATNQVLWTAADAQTWMSSSFPEAEMAGNVLDWMLQSWSLESAYVWDLVAAVTATDPELCPEVHLAVGIELGAGPEQGRTIVENEPANIWVCLDPDSGQIKARASSIMGQKH
ncbi:MAG: nucleoside hydrolase [Thermodesulfovibrionia bacterium]|nr:nucleoside hydrolase [Thermodesulfovibrionia bacterium]